MIVLLGLIVSRSAGQSREPITEARVRALVRQVSRVSQGDATELVLALDDRVRTEWGDFESFPLSIVRSEALHVTISAPYMSFRRSLVDALRIGRPIEQATWNAAIVVDVEPRRIDAPDLASITLSRDGRTVAPVKNALRPMTFSNGRGEERVIHAGDVHFVPSAFSPGGTVVLTFAPRGLEAIVHAFSEAELRSLK